MFGFSSRQPTKKLIAKKRVSKKHFVKKGTKKVVKKGVSKSKPIVCGSIKNRPACLRLNRKCKYSTKTKRCQRR
jgi:hypothetical protein